jgi:iron complex outermembrane receptor protein
VQEAAAIERLSTMTAGFCLTLGALAPTAAADIGPPAGAASPGLEEVRVYASRLAIGADASLEAIKAGVPLQELPVSVETVGADLLGNAGMTDAAAALDGYTLAIATPGERGLFEQILLRGFTDTPFYRNGVAASLGALPVYDLANVEAIEVLKGPNGALYGPGEPGGTINIRTKQPQPEPSHSLRAGLGDAGRFRAELDTTGQLAADAGLSYRFVGAAEQAGSFREHVDMQRRFASPSVAWRPNERLEVVAALEFFRHVAPFDTGTIAIDGAFQLPRERFLGEPATGETRVETLTTSLDVEYRWHDTWTASARLLHQRTRIDGLHAEPVGLDGAMLARELLHEQEYARAFSAQGELQGDVRTGPLRHRLLLGYEYDGLRDRSQLDVSDSEDEPFSIDVFDAHYGTPLPLPGPEEHIRETVHQHALYLQDFVRFGEHWRLLAGTRIDYVSAGGHERVEDRRFQQSDADWSSRAGVVFTPWPALSLFGSFAESLDPNEGLLPTGEPLRPTRGRALEAGVRVRLPWREFNFDGAVFDIRQTDVTVDAPGRPGFEIQTARQDSEGLDLELSLRPWPHLRTGLAYTYTDAAIRGDPEIPDGTAPLNVPLHKLVVYALLSASLRHEEDLRAGMNVVCQSDRQASLSREESGVALDGFTTVNVFATLALSSRVEFGIRISNLLDEDYLAGSQSDLLHVAPGAPRTVYGTLELRF